MAERDGAEVGEPKESDEVATFLLRRADVVMEAWQVANALRLMSLMIPKDKRRRKKLREAAEYVVTNFVDGMVKEHFKETKENVRRWREEIDSQDSSRRRATNEQEGTRTEESAKQDDGQQLKRSHPRTGG